MARVGIFVITVALIAGMIGCVGVKYDLTIVSTAVGSLITPGEGTFTYDADDVVDLVAVQERELLEQPGLTNSLTTY